MPYRLHSNESLEDGIRRILDEQIQRSLAELADGDLDRATTIHQVRKRCKKVRAVLRLVRSGLGKAYAKENAWYRDAARRISDLRDTGAMLETCAALAQHFPAERQLFQPICQQLEMRQQHLLQDAQAIDTLLQDFAAAMQAGQQRVPALSIKGDGHQSALAGLGKTYAQARRAMKTALNHPNPENFHQWRKWVKYHGYHLRLVHAAWPPVVKARGKEADRLGELLGDHHNLFVLQEWVHQHQALAAKKAALKKLDRLITPWTAQLEQDSKFLGRRLFAEKATPFSRRFGIYIKTWASDA